MNPFEWCLLVIRIETIVSQDKPSGGATEVRAVFTRAGGYLLLQRSPPTQGIGLWGIYLGGERGGGGGGGGLRSTAPSFATCGQSALPCPISALSRHYQ